MNQAVQTQPRTVSHYEILGLRLQVECTCARTHSEIFNNFRAHARPVQEQSPDYLVRLKEPLEKDRLRYLFRCQSLDRYQDLAIDVRQRGTDWRPWFKVDPVLIPYSFSELADRFCALHASSVISRRSGRATVFLGERGSGKTTVSLRLAKQFGWPLLSDETSVIDIWSKMVWPLLRTPLVCTGKAGPFKELMFEKEMSEVEKGAISHVGQIIELVLVPGLSKPQILPVSDPMTALSCLFRHDRAFGSKVGLVAKTIAELARDTNFMQIMHGGYEQLLEISHVLDRLDHESNL